MNRMPHLPSPDRAPVRFSFDDNVDRVNMTIMNDLCVVFSPDLARLLGFRPATRYCVSPWLGQHKMDFGSTVRSIYTYCDLVKHVPSRGRYQSSASPHREQEEV